LGQFGPVQYYYSSRHIARDFVSTAAPLTFFLALAAISLPGLRDIVKVWIQSLDPAMSWMLALGAMAGYLLIAYVAGALANRVFLIPRHKWINRWLRFRQRFEYQQFYPSNESAIRAWHAKFFPEWGGLVVTKEAELEHEVDQLLWLFQLVNPAGLDHVYREYAYISMYRQSFVYSCILGWFAYSQRQLSVLWIAIMLAVCAIAAVQANILEAVESEFNFIMSTGSALEAKILPLLVKPGANE